MKKEATHGPPTPLATHQQSVRVWAASGNGYGWVRLLVGLHMVVELHGVYGLRRLDMEKVTLVLEWFVLRPEFEDNLHGFLHSLSGIRGLSVQAENLKVGVHAP